MKELSIEEKAKAYDEAIEYAHYLINEQCKEGTDGSFHLADLQKMFPELKESEDERIRKEMIFYFQEEIPQCSIQEHADKMKEFIAWLKAQGKNNMGISEATKQKLEDNLNKALEKETPEYCNAFLDEQSKQKIINKIVLKFKVGDTVKDPFGNTYHIVEIMDDSYKTDNGRFILFKSQGAYTLINNEYVF